MIGTASSPPPAPATLLQAHGLCVRYGQRTILHDVSLSLAPARTLAVVGESGSGKSTLARAILRLVPIAAGRIIFHGQNLTTLPPPDLRRARAQMQMIFQDPIGSMNPRHRVLEILTEPLIIHRPQMFAHDRQVVAAALLDRCGMPLDSLDRYPHEFSGGQRQRLAIVRALMLQPSLIICDEPTSALDVSVRAQILNLLADLQQERGISYLFITHDMATVQHMAHDVLVLREGHIVESGACEQVLTAPREPYTKALLDAVLAPPPLN